MRACLRAQDKRLSVLYGRLQEEAADDPIMSALYGRQQAHFQMVELAAKAARAERGHVRKQRQTRIMNAALDLGRNQQPFSRSPTSQPALFSTGFVLKIRKQE